MTASEKPGCTAQDALSPWYSTAQNQAEARLKKGWRQARCQTCGLYRWADQPCEIAVFDRPPKRGS